MYSNTASSFKELFFFMTKPITEYSYDELVNSENQQQTYSDEPITWAYIAGLLQTDGTFSFMWTRRDGTFCPRVFLTFGQKRYNFAKYRIQAFFTEQNIRTTLNPRTLKNARNISDEKGVNVVIENNKNVNILIQKLSEEFDFSNSICFADGKLRDYLLLKKALELNERIKSSRDPNFKTTEKCRLVFIKLKMSERATSEGSLTKEQWLERLRIDPTRNVQSLGQGLYDEIVEEAKALNQQFSNFTKYSPKNPNLNKLRQYFTGVFEGDGSFSIGLFTHLTREGTPQRERRPLEFVASASVTDLYDPDKFADQGFNKVLNSWFETSRKGVEVEKGKKGNRIFWKSQADILKVSSRLDNLHINRLEFRRRHTERLALALQNSEVYNNPAFAKQIIDLRFNPSFSDPSHMPSNTIDFYYRLINDYTR